MRSIIIIAVVVLLTPFEGWAQYLQYDSKMIDKIKCKIGEIPSKDTKDSVDYLIDQDYFAVAKAIRDIAGFDKDQRKIFKIDESLYRQCFILDSVAWEQNIECNTNTMLKFFKDKNNNWIEKLPVNYIGILCKCIDDVYDVNDSIKNRFNRPRPWYNFWDSEKGGRVNYMKIRQYYPVKKWDEDCLKKTDRSYPSGHSVICFASAMVLGEFMETLGIDNCQSEKIRLIRKASEFAMSRVVLGVHHYSDVRASYREAKIILDLIYQDQHFKKDMNKHNSTTNEYNEDYSIGIFKEVAKLRCLRAYCLTHERYYDGEIKESSDEKSKRLLGFGYECFPGCKGCRFFFTWKY